MRTAEIVTEGMKKMNPKIKSLVVCVLFIGAAGALDYWLVGRDFVLAIQAGNGAVVQRSKMRKIS